MKQWIAALGAGMILLCGCSGQGSEKPEETAGSTGDETILLAVFAESEDLVKFRETADAFTARYPQVEVKIAEEAAETAGDTILCDAESGADVFVFAGSEEETLFSSGVLLPLNEDLTALLPSSCRKEDEEELKNRALSASGYAFAFREDALIGVNAKSGNTGWAVLLASDLAR